MPVSRHGRLLCKPVKMEELEAMMVKWMPSALGLTPRAVPIAP
jgi:hypothetical protein